MSCGSLQPAYLNDLLLIPVSFRLMSQTEQYQTLAANNEAAAALRCIFYNFFYILRRAKRYCNQKKVYCPYTVNWNIGTTLTLSGRCLAEYHDYIIDHPDEGFAYILWSTWKIVKNEEKRRNEIQDGKAVCNFYPTCQ